MHGSKDRRSRARKRWMFLGITFFLLIASVAMFFTKSVAVKMLPFDNKNEFQVVLDLPEGTTLERTSAVTKEIGAYLSTRTEVVNYQTYVGTSAPITFNGLVRHYDLRGGSNMADIQVNLVDKHIVVSRAMILPNCLDPKFKNWVKSTMPTLK